MDEAGDGPVYWIVFYFLSGLIRTDRTAFYFTGLFLCEYTKVILKLAYGQPRPFWVWDSIECFESSTMFGLPSGHSCDATFICLMVLLDNYAPSQWFG